MITITDQLLALSNGILKLQPEVRDQTGHYQMFDDGGTEAQVSEFLWGLVRLVQPERILETGTYTGISALYMGQALKDNGHGMLTTLEIERFHRDRAVKLWQQVGVAQYIECVLQPSLDFKPEGEYDFLFLDSEPHLRFAELEKFYPYLKEGGYIGIHDLPRSLCQGNVNPDHPEIPSWPFLDIPEKMKEWLKTGKLVKFHLPAPRGLVFFYKPREDDLKI